MKVKLIVEGGEMKSGPAVAQQLGPMGINLGKLIEDVNKKTTNFKGMKVPVELHVEPKTKTYTIEVLSPPVSELLKKEMGSEKGSGEAGKIMVGNIAFENIIKIALMKQPSLPARDIKGAVSEVVGTCVSMGVLIDSKEAKEIASEVREGVREKQIYDAKTEVSEEKKTELEKFWKELKERQEKSRKALEEAKAAEEAKKTEQAAKATPEAGAAVAKKDEKKEEKPKKELKRK